MDVLGRRLWAGIWCLEIWRVRNGVGMSFEAIVAGVGAVAVCEGEGGYFTP